jgi:hypothetical protein
MKIDKVLITPEMATRLLVSNTNNRNISNSRVLRYVNDILNDRWVEDTGELIKIDTDGNVIDGQHRLTAIVKANKSIYVHLATDVSKYVFDVIDSGKSRTSGDVLKIAGVKSATKVASFIQMYNQMKNTKHRYDGINLEHALTSKMLLIFYNENKLFIDNVIKKSSILYEQFQKIWNSGEVALFYGLLTEVDLRLGQEFMRELCQGTDITNDCIILLRNRLISDKVSTSNKLTVPTRKALVIKTWNSYYLGKTLKCLKFNPDVESYPKIIGLEN